MTITFEDLLERWKAQVDAQLADTPRSCEECLRGFSTGDVVLVFAPNGGDIAIVATKKFFLCARCGYMAIVSNNVPAATMVYVEESDKARPLARLGPEKVALIKEAFAIADRIHEFMAELASRSGTNVIPPKDEVPS